MSYPQIGMDYLAKQYPPEVVKDIAAVLSNKIVCLICHDILKEITSLEKHINSVTHKNKFERRFPDTNFMKIKTTKIPSKQAKPIIAEAKSLIKSPVEINNKDNQTFANSRLAPKPTQEDVICPCGMCTNERRQIASQGTQPKIQPQQAHNSTHEDVIVTSKGIQPTAQFQQAPRSSQEDVKITSKGIQRTIQFQQVTSSTQEAVIFTSEGTQPKIQSQQVPNSTQGIGNVKTRFRSLQAKIRARQAQNSVPEDIKCTSSGIQPKAQSIQVPNFTEEDFKLASKWEQHKIQSQQAPNSTQGDDKFTSEGIQPKIQSQQAPNSTQGKVKIRFRSIQAKIRARQASNSTQDDIKITSSGSTQPNIQFQQARNFTQDIKIASKDVAVQVDLDGDENSNGKAKNDVEEEIFVELKKMIDSIYFEKQVPKEIALQFLSGIRMKVEELQAIYGPSMRNKTFS